MTNDQRGREEGGGSAPTITLGPYAGEIATADRIIPRSVCPELDNRLYNLEFMPETLNNRKADKITERQEQLARKWNAAGLLSDEGLRAVEAAVTKTEKGRDPH